MNKIPAIEAALRCFVCGLLTLIPLFGLPFGVAAVIFYGQSSASSVDDWNPARRYAFLGLAFAVIGFFITATAGWWAAANYFKNEF